MAILQPSQIYLDDRQFGGRILFEGAAAARFHSNLLREKSAKTDGPIILFSGRGEALGANHQIVYICILKRRRFFHFAANLAYR